MRFNANFAISAAAMAALLICPAGAFAQSDTGQSSQTERPHRRGQTDRSPGSQANEPSTMGQTGAANRMGTTKASPDARFVREAAEGGLMEVELGRIAQEKASSQEVKDFGKRMVDDHSKANDQLKDIAAKQNIDLPTEVNSKQRQVIDRLSNLSGEQFDKAYMQHMVKDHRKDVSEFQKEAKNGKDADIKSFASNTLPTLQEHLDLAKKISGSTSQSADRMKKSPTPQTEQNPNERNPNR
jgi:putative membrane protein